MASLGKGTVQGKVKILLTAKDWPKMNLGDITPALKGKTLLITGIIERIVHEFQNLDYHVSYRKLCSSNFGLAQKRERVYIMCARSRLIDLSVISTSNRAVTFE